METVDGQLCAGIHTVRDGVHAVAQQNHQRRHGADHDGIHEHLKDAVQALLDGVIHVGGSMGHRGRTQTGLVGEDAPAHAFLYHCADAHAGQTAGSGGGVEGTPEDGGKGGGEGGGVDHDNRQSGADIQNRHGGNQQGAHVGDAGHAAQ